MFYITLFLKITQNKKKNSKKTILCTKTNQSIEKIINMQFPTDLLFSIQLKKELKQISILNLFNLFNSHLTISIIPFLQSKNIQLPFSEELQTLEQFEIQIDEEKIVDWITYFRQKMKGKNQSITLVFCVNNM